MSLLALADFKYCAHSQIIYFGLGNIVVMRSGNFERRCVRFNLRIVTMKMILFWFVSVLMALGGGFLYGKSQAKTQIVEKQVEVIKYAARKRAEIQARPNANRDELLMLMRSGNL